MPIRNRTSDIIDSLLVGLAATSAVAFTVVAPNSLVALEKPLFKLIDGKDKRREARRIGRYLKQQKLVTVTPLEDGSYSVSLTENGKKRSQKAYFEQITIPSEAWDKKWRVVMFDIPEKYKAERDFVSRHLARVGFHSIQKSVFVFPFPADAFMAVLYNVIPEVRPYIIYMTVTEIDSHNDLVKQFSKLF